ncbi:TPA: hypothetical protein SI488_004353 [Escherichia coli]|nr:hypothetical protein [Escherichia coli]
MITNIHTNITRVIISNNMKEDIKAYMQIKTCCTTREVAEAMGIR